MRLIIIEFLISYMLHDMYIAPEKYHLAPSLNQAWNFCEIIKEFKDQTTANNYQSVKCIKVIQIPLSQVVKQIQFIYTKTVINKLRMSTFITV